MSTEDLEKQKHEGMLAELRKIHVHEKMSQS